jgi:heavy metal translocating P-type ATPase
LLSFGVILSGFIMAFACVLYFYPALPDHLRIQLQYVMLALATPVVLGMGYPYLKNAIGDLRGTRMSMATLIAFGTFTAYIYSVRVTVMRGSGVYFDTAAMVIVLVTLGTYLQARARARMAQAMRTLAAETPILARKLDGNQETLVRADEIAIGDFLRALPSERIAADGKIVSGKTTVDQSFLTGESRPIPREPGERILRGSVNLEGTIVYEALSVGRDTLEAQIERMCAEAIGSRMPMQALADKISARFVAATVLIALFTCFYWGLVRHQSVAGFMNALAVLVVACPCALGIATPMATFVALRRAAKEGVLIRTPEALERMRRIDTVVFDKTGTLTEGKLTVTGVIASCQGGYSAEELLRIAASLADSSEHHLARAILERFRARHGRLLSVREFVNHPGEGIAGKIILENEASVRAFLGSARSLEARGFELPKDLANSPASEGLESRVYIAWDKTIRGIIRLGDTLRPAARAAIDACKQQGIAVHLLSGDGTACTKQVAEDANIDSWSSEQTPQQKVAYIRSLEKAGHRVAMVGDGTNDAPALAQAEVGIAHQLGTDLSKEAAEVHILAGDLRLVPWVLELSRKTFSSIRGNLFWAFAYNSAAIALAAAGMLRPVAAAAAMLASSAMVIGNSMRLERMRGVRKTGPAPIPRRGFSSECADSQLATPVADPR